MGSGAGVGSSPFGTGAYGFGTPATVPVPGGLVNRDNAGRQLGSLAISLEPGTRGRYVFDQFGRRMGMPDVDQMVILALLTVRGSCVVPDLGHTFGEVRKVTDNFAQEQQTRVEAALASLVRRGLVRIDSITVDPRNGHPSMTRVQLTNLSTLNPIDIAI